MHDHHLPDGWRRDSLCHVAEIRTGLAKGPRNGTNTVAMPYLRVANVQDGFLDLDEIKQIEVPENKIARYSLKTNDVLLTEGGDFDKLGRGCLWRGEIPKCLHQNHIFVVRTDSTQLVPEFLAVWTGSPRGRSYFLSCSKQSTNLASINSTQLKEMPIDLPPKAEQERICHVLGRWDAGLDLLARRINAATSTKKGLMQQLLTGKRRFPEFVRTQWRRVKLASLLEYTPRPTPKPRESYVALGVRSHCKGTFQRQVEDPQSVAMDTLYRVEPGDLIINITFAWEGAIALARACDEGRLVSHRFPTYRFVRETADAEYLMHLFTTRRFIHELKLISPGGAGRNRVFNKKDFLKLEVEVPGLPEQRRIASVLNEADKEIDLLEKLRGSLQEQKKGLMQQLLTGKLRVPVKGAPIEVPS